MEILDDDFKQHSLEDAAKIKLLKMEAAQLRKQIIAGRVALFYIAGSYAAAFIYELLIGQFNMWMIFLPAVTIGIFTTLGLIIKQNPFTVLTAGLLIFATIKVYFFVSNPDKALSGTPILIIILGLLAVGIAGSFKFKKVKRELQAYGEDFHL